MSGHVRPVERRDQHPDLGVVEPEFVLDLGRGDRKIAAVERVDERRQRKQKNQRRDRAALYLQPVMAGCWCSRRHPAFPLIRLVIGRLYRRQTSAIGAQHNGPGDSARQGRNSTPVIASDLSVFREIAGDIPTYLPSWDGVGWERTVREFVGEPPERQRQLACMSGYRAPDWDEHFRQVDALLAEVLAA